MKLDATPLLEAAGYRPHTHGAKLTATRLGVSQRQVLRWAGGQQVTLGVADRCAIRLDRHPVEIWGGGRG